MRRVFAFAAVALASLVALCRGFNEGDGTAYSGDYDKDATGFNSCQFGKLNDYFERYYCALPSHVFDRKHHCGRCIKVRGTEGDSPGKWVKLMIVDECASCEGDGDVDMSVRGLKESTGYGWDRKRIEWAYTSCGGPNTRDNNDDPANDDSTKNDDSTNNDDSKSRNQEDETGDNDDDDSDCTKRKRKQDKND